jgi:uncharacterized protein YdeI (BOF family)
MKTKKILIAALICAVPLGAFAYDKYKDHDRGDHRKSSYHNCDNRDSRDYDFEYDDFDVSEEFMEKNGVNLAFEGIVEKMPKNQFNGVWTISGKKVTVDNKTRIFMEKNINPKDEVEVLSKRENGKIYAVMIAQD